MPDFDQEAFKTPGIRRGQCLKCELIRHSLTQEQLIAIKIHEPLDFSSLPKWFIALGRQWPSRRRMHDKTAMRS